MLIIRQYARIDIEESIRFADAVRGGAMALVSKEGNNASNDWFRKKEKLLTDGTQ